MTYFDADTCRAPGGLPLGLSSAILALAMVATTAGMAAAESHDKGAFSGLKLPAPEGRPADGGKPVPPAPGLANAPKPPPIANAPKPPPIAMAPKAPPVTAAPEAPAADATASAPAAQPPAPPAPQPDEEFPLRMVTFLDGVMCLEIDQATIGGQQGNVVVREGNCAPEDARMWIYEDGFLKARIDGTTWCLAMDPNAPAGFDGAGRNVYASSDCSGTPEMMWAPDAVLPGTMAMQIGSDWGCLTVAFEEELPAHRDLIGWNMMLWPVCEGNEDQLVRPF